MRTRIHGVRVFDGERGAGVQDVVLEDDLIVAVCAPGAAGAADVEVDGRGRTLLPGLIDAHTHVFDGSLAEALRHGVTTELDMFCLPRPLARHRQLAAERDDVADLRSAGSLATAPGGHPTQLLAALTGTLLDPADVTEIDFLTDPERAADFVKARLAEGSDFLKLVIDDGTVHGTDLPVLSPAVAGALTSAARAAGLRVVAHAVTAADAVTALDAGVDGLAHVWADLAPQDPASVRLARRVRDQGVFVVSTLAYFEAVDAQGSGAAACVPPAGTRPPSARSARCAGRASRSSPAPTPRPSPPPTARGSTVNWRCSRGTAACARKKRWPRRPPCRPTTSAWPTGAGSPRACARTCCSWRATRPRRSRPSARSSTSGAADGGRPAESGPAHPPSPPPFQERNTPVSHERFVLLDAGEARPGRIPLPPAFSVKAATGTPKDASPCSKWCWRGRSRPTPTTWRTRACTCSRASSSSIPGAAPTP